MASLKVRMIGFDLVAGLTLPAAQPGSENNTPDSYNVRFAPVREEGDGWGVAGLAPAGQITMSLSSVEFDPGKVYELMLAEVAA